MNTDSYIRDTARQCLMEARSKGQLRAIFAKLNLRRGLLKASKILGDLKAAEKGKIGRRILRRKAGKITGGLLRRIFG